MRRQVVLASSSPYRRQMLERINLTFITHAPQIDECPELCESAPALVARLSLAKARAVARHYPEALVIGSDQVAEHHGKIVGKPLDHADAVNQLESASGSVITLYSGLVLYNAHTDSFQSVVEPFIVEFRQLDRGTIERYLETEKPYNCCGSLKAEGLGITLLKRLKGDDPNALIGLPVIRLVDMLKNEGIELV